MKKYLLSITLSALIFSACKENTTTPTVAEDAILKEVKALPEITQPLINQAPFKKIDMELLLPNNPQAVKYSYSLDYYSDGKIKSISEGGKDMYRFDYQKNNLTIQETDMAFNIKLSDNGLAEYNQGTNSTDRYYFKNNFLIKRRDRLTEDFNYSANGNLLNYKGAFPAEYEYTNYPNTIRQEVLAPMAVHWTFRDSYLGNFSTNLIKKAVFSKGTANETTLDFNYDFDGENRVSKVTIDRKDPIGTGKIVYLYTY